MLRKQKVGFQNDMFNPLDSIRNEFDLKKSHTAYLIIGKSAEELFSFYQFYLKERDNNRADSLLNTMLKLRSTVGYKYKISLISYYYTSDAKTRLLFLTNPDSITSNRNYFIKIGTSLLKSNVEKRAHYYDLVALDSVSLNRSSDRSFLKKAAGHFNSLAWYSILTQQLSEVPYFLEQSLKYDATSNYPKANWPLYLLLKGRFKQAKVLYLKLKDQPFDTSGSTFREEFLEDFKELAAAGITNEDIGKIILLLNSK